MKKILALIIALMVLPIVFAEITGSETMTRTVPTTVNPSSSFTLTYTAIGTSGSWGATIEDAVTGGCLFPSGSNTYRTVMLSEDGNTKSITMTAPSSGSCTFSGDYKYGSFDIKPFTASTITIQSIVCSSNTDCDDSNLCTTDTCLNNACQHVPVQCQSGYHCVNGACVAISACSSNTDCNDNNVCTSDTCTSGSCSHSNAADGTSCGTDKECQSGSCVSTDECENFWEDFDEETNKCEIASWIPIAGILTVFFLILSKL